MSLVLPTYAFTNHRHQTLIQNGFDKIRMISCHLQVILIKIYKFSIYLKLASLNLPLDIIQHIHGSKSKY